MCTQLHLDVTAVGTHCCLSPAQSRAEQNHSSPSSSSSSSLRPMVPVRPGPAGTSAIVSISTVRSTSAGSSEAPPSLSVFLFCFVLTQTHRAHRGILFVKRHCVLCRLQHQGSVTGKHMVSGYCLQNKNREPRTVWSKCGTVIYLSLLRQDSDINLINNYTNKTNQPNMYSTDDLNKPTFTCDLIWLIVKCFLVANLILKAKPLNFLSKCCVLRWVFHI